MKFLILIFKNLRRNLLRTTLTSLAIMVLVFVVTLIWSVLSGLYRYTKEQSGEQKLIVTEKWQVPSQMPPRYGDEIEALCNTLPSDVRPTDYMTWQFYGGTLDPDKRTPENIIFFFAMEPKKLRTMMEELEDIDPKIIAELEQNEQAILVGPERLRTINKRVGDKITVTSLNYKDINLEFKIIGTFSVTRYNQSAVMNRDYLNRALDDYKNKNRGTPHPMADKSLNLVWIKVRDSHSAGEVSRFLETSGKFTQPAVKCETMASGISNFMEAYSSMLWAMQWGLTPVILITMSLVVANAISISVRERLTEIAVLKVLGFQPWQVLTLVLGEALLVGSLSGLLSTALTYAVVNYVMGGVNFRIAFFPAFPIPLEALAWGLIIGAGTALIGSIVPAWSARTVKVSEVFAKVA
jgi:putative ABC transport system permease protein